MSLQPGFLPEGMDEHPMVDPAPRIETEPVPNDLEVAGSQTRCGFQEIATPLLHVAGRQGRIMAYGVKCFAEKAFLFDIIVVFNYIVVQVDNVRI
jgi:hypothetical protein